MRKFFIKKQLRAMELKNKALTKTKEAKELLKNKDGGGVITTETLIWIAVGAVIVLIVAGLLIAFIKSDFFPAFKAKMQEIFNLK